MLGHMARISQLFRFRSLSLAVFALLLSPWGVACCAGFIDGLRFHGSRFLFQATVICLVGLAVCVGAFINLVRDAGRGYSPNRSALAAVFLLLAISPHVLLAFLFLWHFTRQ